MHVSLSFGQNATVVLWKIICHASRFSESVLIEFTSNAVIMRFTAPNRTTHLCVKFPSMSENLFTSTYNIHSESVQADADSFQPTESINYHVAYLACRPLILSLRPYGHLNLLRCTFVYSSRECQLSITNQYIKGLTKKFNFTLSETVLEKPIEDRNLGYVVVCHALHLNKIFEAFPSQVNRLTMKPDNGRVDFTAESHADSETPSMDSSICVTSGVFSEYQLPSNIPSFSKTFDPKGFRAFVDLASYLNLPFRLEASPGTNPVSLELQSSENGIFTITMLIASYDEIGMRNEHEARYTERNFLVPTQDPSDVAHEVTGNHPVSMAHEVSNVSKLSCRKQSQLEFSSQNMTKNHELHPNASIVSSQTRPHYTPAPILSFPTDCATARSKNAITTPEPSIAPTKSHCSLQVSNIHAASMDIAYSPLAEKYAQGVFPLHMSPRGLGIADNDRLYQSLESFYGTSESLHLEDCSTSDVL